MKTLILAMLLALCGTALADSPHFVRAAASLDADANLVVSFKIAGLGSNVTATISTSADASATFGCRTRSGNFPSAANKQDVAGPVGASGDFTSGKNGSITGSLTASPPASDLTCPHGQTRVVCQVTYAGIELTSDLAGVVSLGDLSVTPFPECL